MPAIRALIVEDDAALARLLGRTLEASDADFEIAFAVNLADATTALEEQFDIVLLDLDLADSTGLSMLKAVVARTEAAILVLTTEDDENLASRAIELGAHGSISKSQVTMVRLITAVKLAVRTQRSDDLSDHRFRLDVSRASAAVLADLAVIQSALAILESNRLEANQLDAVGTIRRKSGEITQQMHALRQK